MTAEEMRTMILRLLDEVQCVDMRELVRVIRYLVETHPGLVRLELRRADLLAK